MATKGVVCGCGMVFWVVFETVEIVENTVKQVNARGWTRTIDLRFRKPVLYPAELREQG